MAADIKVPGHALVEIHNQTDAMTHPDLVVFTEAWICECGHKSSAYSRMYLDPDNRRWTDAEAKVHKDRAMETAILARKAHLEAAHAQPE